jgi:cytochrome P450/NADPH-cytochrome P450 reductase
MTEYTLRPAILPCRGWRNFLGGSPAASAGAGGAARAAVHARTLRGLRALVRAAALQVGAAMVAVNRSRPSVLVCHASVSGTAARGAARLRGALSDAFVAWSLDLADFRPSLHAVRLAGCSAVIFVTSTYGSGAPPPDAGAFLTWAATDAAVPTLRGLRCAVLGFGSSAYPRFCAAADTFAGALVAAGAAAPLAPLGRIDALAGGEAAFCAWVAALARGLAAAAPALRASPPPGSPAAEALAARLRALEGAMGARLDAAATARKCEWEYVRAVGLPARLRASRWPRTVLARVVACEELLAAAPEGAGAGAAAVPPRSVVRVALDTSAVPGGVPYAPGDNVAIFPRQSAAALARAAAAFGLEHALDEDFSLAPAAPLRDGGGGGARPPFPTPTSLRTALGTFLALGAAPGAADLAALAAFATGDDAATLARLLADATGRAAEQWVAERGLDWPGVFEALPSLRGAVPPAALVLLIPPQHPRYYSASSSPAAAGGGAARLELTVALDVRARSNGAGGWREGACSSYLRGLAAGEGGALVELRVIRVPTFRLPTSHFAPVLAVASGSGLAPFRAFWEERAHRVREAARAGAGAGGAPPLGPFVLLHGSRAPSERLYAGEVAAAVAGGAITEAHVAYSRAPGAPKVYVQHLLAPGAPLADRLRHMLRGHPKAAVYVCGDAGMAAEVVAALAALLGADAFAALRAEGRYHEDVFGIIAATAGGESRVKAQ